MKIRIYKFRFIRMLILRFLIFFLSLYLLIENYRLIIEFQFYNFLRIKFSFLVLIDWISCIFISFVLIISSIVVNYRIEYIIADIKKDRFLILVLIFVLSIVLLIISPNLIRILLGWDGLGFVSYCLVIYFQNIKSYRAGIITILSNRIGDISLLFSIIFIINYGSWNFIIYKRFIRDINIDKVILFVLIASITKRAQIPFSSWLPIAIAAPTPVSALVHSSTLVTAGVYLIIRFNYIFNNSLIINLLLIISRLTIFIAGIGANYEFDLKKIIALSTLSQLRLMIVILSIGNYELAFFHLLVHALFKALMFLCAGVIIHNLMAIQDIRKIGSLINIIPLECSCLILRNLILCGMPFLSGFYSKDLILEIIIIININLFCLFLVIISTGLTVIYCIRLIYYLIIMDYQFYSFLNISNKIKNIRFRIVFIIILRLFIGRILIWLIFPFPSIIVLPFFIKNLILILCLLGGIIGYFINKINTKIFLNRSINNNIYKIFIFNRIIWFLPNISVNLFINKTIKIRKVYIKIIDFGWSEYYGRIGLFYYILRILKKIQLYHSNNFRYYMLIFYFWLLIIFIILIFIYSNSL